MANTTPIYMDIPTDFSVNMFTGDLNVVYDIDVIKQSILNLVKTTFYSRVNEPQLGCSVNTSLFDMLDSITINEIDNSIREVIANYEKRANVNSVSVQENIPQKSVLITVYFTATISSELHNVTLTLKRFR